MGPGGPAEYLPVLWDVGRDRAARAGYRPMPSRGVLLVPGPLLQGVGLAFDVVVHLRVAPAARRRRFPAEQAWELPAFDRYDDEVDPMLLADAVVLADRPEHPALVLQGRFA
ncbi:nucleoside/nucleotide kinase family protein [Geodermatophilus arenarius]|uniref:Uridine kinase n=1 Tax=Geodermatophilus arenarius TaxID=1137990 RepID=A0ABV9LKQ1_9ACTN